MNIGFVGLGKLGLPVALAIESKGHTVCGYDVNYQVKKHLKQRKIPFKEEGIQPLLDKHSIEWRDSIKEVVRNSDIVFVPVQTPHGPEYEGATPLPNDRKDFDYSYLVQCLSEVALSCEMLHKKVIVAVISTCLPGTFKREVKPLLNEWVDYVYTPQFIAMGTVLEDYLYPEFNLIGVHSVEASKTLQEFYATINDAPNLVTDITTAEGIKVSYNTWITAKTVLANAWGEMSHRLGMNFDDMYRAWLLSTKRLVSPRYMNSGVGDGGGCHPRDNIALSYIADKVGMSHNIWEDLMAAREAHMAWLGGLGVHEANRAKLPLVILGRSFKPETNIETGSPSILMANLLDYGYTHVDDLEVYKKAVYIIGTRHERYKSIDFPKGSVVIDPFRYIPERVGIKNMPIGGRI